MDLAGTHSNRTDILQRFTEVHERIEKSGPRKPRPSRGRTSGGPKKQLRPEELAEIVAKYEAGASMVATEGGASHGRANGCEGAVGGRCGDPAKRRAEPRSNPIYSVGAAGQAVENWLRHGMYFISSITHQQTGRIPLPACMFCGSNG